MLLFIFSLIFLSQVSAFEWHGHRGARGLYPENTIGGMKEALKYPVTTIEMDLVISADDEVIVSHDPWMNRKLCLAPNGDEIGHDKINLYKMYARNISEYDCGSKYYKKFPHQQKVTTFKPRLKDLLKTLEEEYTGIHYSFEIKSSKKAQKKGFQPHFTQFTELAVQEILKFIPTDRFIIQSFDTRVLSYLRQKYPQIKIVLLRGLPFHTGALLKSLNFTPDYVSPDHRILCRSNVEDLHQRGIKVIPFTVNDKKTFLKMKKMKVDGILTDYPDLIPELISNLPLP